MRPCGSVCNCVSLYSGETIRWSVRAQERLLGLSGADTACLVLSNDIHRFAEFPFHSDSLCCLLLEICFKPSLFWNSPHFQSKLIPERVFLLFVRVPKTSLSVSVNSFSLECLSFSAPNTHTHTHTFAIYTYLLT